MKIGNYETTYDKEKIHVSPEENAIINEEVRKKVEKKFQEILRKGKNYAKYFYNILYYQFMESDDDDLVFYGLFFSKMRMEVDFKYPAAAGIGFDLYTKIKQYENSNLSEEEKEKGIKKEIAKAVNEEAYFITFNPIKMALFNRDERIAVVKHEINHMLRLHHLRFFDPNFMNKSEEERNLENIVLDKEINGTFDKPNILNLPGTKGHAPHVYPAIVKESYFLPLYEKGLISEKEFEEILSTEISAERMYNILLSVREKDPDFFREMMQNPNPNSNQQQGQQQQKSQQGQSQQNGAGLNGEDEIEDIEDEDLTPEEMKERIKDYKNQIEELDKILNEGNKNQDKNNDKNQNTEPDEQNKSNSNNKSQSTNPEKSGDSSKNRNQDTQSEKNSNSNEKRQNGQPKENESPEQSNSQNGQNEKGQNNNQNNQSLSGNKGGESESKESESDSNKQNNKNQNEKAKNSSQPGQNQQNQRQQQSQGQKNDDYEKLKKEYNKTVNELAKKLAEAYMKGLLNGPIDSHNEFVRNIPKGLNKEMAKNKSLETLKDMIKQTQDEFSFDRPKSRGFMPAEFQQAYDNVVNLLKPQNNYKHILAKIIKNSEGLKSGKKKTWNTRSIIKPFDPNIKGTQKAKKPPLALIIDVSGSMSDAEVLAAYGEIIGIIQEETKRGGAALRVIQADTIVTMDELLENPKKKDIAKIMKRTGNGGTYMEPAIKRALGIGTSIDTLPDGKKIQVSNRRLLNKKSLGVKPKTIFVVTDGYIENEFNDIIPYGMPKQEGQTWLPPDVEIIWIVTGNFGKNKKMAEKKAAEQLAFDYKQYGRQMKVFAIDKETILEQLRKEKQKKISNPSI